LTSSWFLGADSGLPLSLLNTLSAKFADLTTLGITVFGCAGDNGSSGYDNDGKCHIVYPATDPSITSCGGTTIGSVSGSSFEEVVWNDSSGATGGGVSDHFPVPAWQTAAGLTPTSKNDGMVRRGVPDVAANASGNSGFSDIIMGGAPTVGAGTSVVGPLYAGLTAVLNQALGQPIGFLNPTLYALGGSVCRDITSGDNNPNIGIPFYTAGPGWDMCTGWGSLNGAAFLGVLQTLYARNFYFIVDKSTFGVDELSASLVYKNAFWLVLEGFSIDEVGAVVPGFSGPFDGFGGLTITMDSLGVAYEFPGDTVTPQRIRFPYDITFTASSAAAFPGMGLSAEELLTASITVQGMPMTANALFEVEGGADPFFMNIGTTDNAYYLSQDLRVFTITPETDGVMPVGSVPFNFTTGGPSTLDTGAAYNYIQQFLGFLNTTYGDPGNADPFSTLLPDQLMAESGDSSVTPLTGNPGGNPFINYNFAVARVRLNGSGSMAPNTKVFFRLFNTQTFDTDYINTNAFVSAGDPNITFPSTGAADDPAVPLPGTDGNGVINGCSIPFFAAADQSDVAPGGVNNQNVLVSSGDGVWVYFGCYLDVYNPSLMVGGFPVQHWLAGGTHHCLVAQIAFSGAPIVNTGGVIENPGNCDKLAQRNLQISAMGTIVMAAMHRIPMTFDTRPGPVIGARPAGGLTGWPDEVMIDWGNVPVGSVLSIYWPRVSAAAVVELARKHSAFPFLIASDAHTIKCMSHRGVTYIPIPPSVAGEPSFAGLMTIELPEGVRDERGFRVTVRRVRSRVLNADADLRRSLAWRCVGGIFQVSIPVVSAARLLPQEEGLLAMLEWRQRRLSEDNKWHPVLVRYIAEVAARVRALREACMVRV
jgi:hypothetical protein